jgi:hypothetical protein
MIRRLRVRHRLMWLLIAPLLMLMFVAGLWVRKPVPNQDLPGFLVEGPLEVTGRAVHLPKLWGELPITTTLGTSAAGEALVVLDVTGDLKFPDLMVYWGGGELIDREALPAEVHLLGSLTGNVKRAYRLPERSGVLFLYSLAHQRVVARTSIPDLATEQAP